MMLGSLTKLGGPFDFFDYLRDTRYITRHTGSRAFPLPKLSTEYQDALAHAHFAWLHPYYATLHAVTNFLSSLIVVGFIYYAITTVLRAFVSRKAVGQPPGTTSPPQSVGRAIANGCFLIFSVSYILWYCGLMPSSGAVYPEPVRLSYCFAAQGAKEVCHITVTDQRDKDIVIALNPGKEQQTKTVLSGYRGFSIVSGHSNPKSPDDFQVEAVSGEDHIVLPAYMVYKWRSDKYI